MGGLSYGAGLLPAIGSAMGLIRALDATVRSVQTLSGGDDGAAKSRAEQDLSLKQLRAQQAEQQRQTEENAALERARLSEETAESERKRRDALRRAVARQRASFGAQGIGSGGGSAQAVLLGLFDESDADRITRERMDMLRNNALDVDGGQQRRLNLLQVTQLAERQRLARTYA